MAERKSDFTGDRFGDWVVMAKAPAVGGKRFWNVTNSQTDETRVIAQTELKNLETDVPSSRDITTKVVVGNFKDDPFNIPDGILPEDDSEYPFEVEFVEPKVIATVRDDSVSTTYYDDGSHQNLETVNVEFEGDLENPFDVQMSASFNDETADNDDWVDASCELRGCGGNCADDDELMATSPWEPEPDPMRSNILEALRQLDGLRDTLDQILKAALNK